MSAPQSESESESESESKPKRRGSRQGKRAGWRERAHRGLHLGVQVFLLAVLALVPWFYGGVHEALFYVALAAAAALTAWGVAMFLERRSGFRAPWPAVPLVLALLLGMAQLIPFPAAMRGILAPGSEAMRTELLRAEQSVPLADAESTASVLPDWSNTVSIYPAASRSTLALLVLGICFYFLGARFFIHRQALLRLQWVLALNGTALVFFGLIQQAKWQGRMFFTTPLIGGGQPFGPFINRNNAGGYLNLCLAGAVALAVWSLVRSESQGSHSNKLGGRAGAPTLWEQLLRRIGQLNAVQLGSLILTGVIAAGVFCTLSRGALLSTAAATAAATAAMVIYHRKSVIVWALCGLAGMGFAVAACVSQIGSVQSRLSNFLNYPTQSGRIDHWMDGLTAAANFWLTGSGLGSYGFAYPMSQRSPDDLWFRHAENQYLEALVETGFLGLGLLLAAFVCAAVSLAGMLRQSRRPETQSFALLGVFALSSQAVHAFFDFGLLIPANLALFAVICGAMAGRAASRSPDTPGEETEESTTTWLDKLQGCRKSMCVVPILLVAATWSVVEIYRVTVVETPWRTAALELWGRPPRLEQRAILRKQCKLMEEALPWRNDDADAHWRTARLYIQAYQLQAPLWLRGKLKGENRFLHALGDKNLGDSFAGFPKDKTLAELSLLHGVALNLRREGKTDVIDALRSEPLIQDTLAIAREHLLAADRACPLIPEIKYLLAMLNF
ncbi:MAG: O-antigen ligase family protein, partial [Planctomycetales bacterium]